MCNLKLISGILYKKSIDKTLRKVLSIENGNLRVIIDGKKRFGPEIAWNLHYGYWPDFHVILRDDNHLNLSIDNLIPVKNLKRCVIRVFSGKFMHNLCFNQSFETENLCRQHWRICALEYYDSQSSNITVELRVSEVFDVDLPEKPEKVPQTKKPCKVQGKTWHWYKSQWLCIPKAVHVSDDFMRRCDAVLTGKAGFYFDESKEITLSM